MTSKILPLNVVGTAPADNPFVGTAGYQHGDLRSSVFQRGIGLAFHPEHGLRSGRSRMDLQGGDEINIVKSGLNYGWPDRCPMVAKTPAIRPAGCPARNGSSLRAPGLKPPFTFWNVLNRRDGDNLLHRGDQFPALEPRYRSLANCAGRSCNE